jgi:uncharacterized DUF497 family protein
MNFEWDDEKAATNLAKHGLSFEQAIGVFADAERVVAMDERRDYGEERLITTGYIHGRLCVVVYTEQNSVIRIISARKANSREQKRHEHR